MTLQEIKAAVLAGKTVHWASTAYAVKYSERGDCFNIVYTPDGNCTGLTWRDGVTMNGEPHEFFIAGS